MKTAIYIIHMQAYRRPTFPSTKQCTLVDLFASYDDTDWIRADVTLANVFDVRYLDLDRSPGFQARGALTVKFATR